MKIRVSEIKGAKVMTQEGKKVEDIDQILYNPEAKKIVAFLVSAGGLLSEPKLLMMDDVDTFGKDAIFVQSESAIKKSSTLAEPLKKLSTNPKMRLVKTTIIGEDGTEYGKASDIIFDTDTGKVIEVELSQGPMKDMKSGKKTLAIADIISVGKDSTIVSAAGAPTTEPSPMKAQTQKVQMMASSTKESFQNKVTPSRPKKPDTENKPMPFNKRVEDAVGKYVKKNILTIDDRMLAKQGDIITHDLLRSAYTYGVIDHVLDNVSPTPL